MNQYLRRRSLIVTILVGALLLAACAGQRVPREPAPVPQVASSLPASAITPSPSSGASPSPSLTPASATPTVKARTTAVPPAPTESTRSAATATPLFVPGRTWPEVSNLDIGVDSIRDVVFSDPLHGWIAIQNLVLATSDGGKTWVKRYESDETLPGRLSFVTAKKGFAAADQGDIPIRGKVSGPLMMGGGKGEGILVTDDGGTTWQPFGPARIASSSKLNRAQITRLSFVDDRRGWASVTALDSILSTLDGGATWQSLVSPCTFSGNGLKYVGPFSFIDSTTGWMLCSPPWRLFKTTDGGQSWQAVVGDSSGGEPAAVAAYITLSSDLFFLDQVNGWLQSDRSLLSTQDGGRSWRYLVGPAPTEPQPGAFTSRISKVRFFSPTEGLVAVASGSWPRVFSLLETLDGGASWAQIYPPAPPVGVRICQATDLRTGINSYGAMQSAFFQLNVINRSVTRCVLRGSPIIEAVDAAGRAFETGKAGEDARGPTRGLILHPGQRATAEIGRHPNAGSVPSQRTPEVGYRLIVRVAGDAEPLEWDDSQADVPGDPQTGPSWIVPGLFLPVDPPFSSSASSSSAVP